MLGLTLSELSIPCVYGHAVEETRYSRVCDVEHGAPVADTSAVGVIVEGVDGHGEGVDVVHRAEFRVPRESVGEADVFENPLAAAPVQPEEGPRAALGGVRCERVCVGHGAEPEPAPRVTLAIIGPGVVLICGCLSLVFNKRLPQNGLLQNHAT